jgi:phosphoribosylformimino-5-aminoimidazole carboxamide ribotide isomerase
VEIIPVIDLLQGQVVHARRGERHLYQPIYSRLCAGSDPLDIVQALLGLYPFKILYIADLDAITRQGNHIGTIQRIRKTFPDLTLWLDAGIHTIDQLVSWKSLEIGIVIGSENLASMTEYSNLSAVSDIILSLDFNAQGFLGPKELLEASHAWPERLIAMSLPHIGSGLGPDLAQIARLKALAGQRNLFAAGGVRGMEDILTLQQKGVSGTLVASALHDGRMTTQDFLAINP